MADEAGGTTEPGTPGSGGARSRRGGASSGGQVPPSSGTGAGADWAQRPEGYRPRLVRRIGAAVLGVLLVAGLSWTALRVPAGQALDTVLMESVMSWDGALGRLGAVVTGLVSLEASVVVAAVVVVVALLRRRPTLAGRALGIALGANATTQLLKAALYRPDLGVSTVLENSLPSGHVTFAASVSLALVVVAPEWFRTPAAWLGWLWTSLMGITVMVYAWHRPADVITAVAVAGTWALALSPIEHRGRHGTPMRRAMGAIALVLVVLAAIGITVALAGTDLGAQAMPGATDYGFATFLHAHPWRERLLALCSAVTVTGVVGVVVHEVDRLSWS
ncbi:MAG: phosphatase PAP2 family protein [Pauljensenia sp.]